MGDLDRLLIEILASVDATFRPMRAPDWTSPTPTVLYEARTSYATAGVPLTVGGSTGRRKSGERDLAALIDAGLVVGCGAERRRGVRLTDQGEHVGRALAGLPSMADSLHLLRDTILRSVEHADHGALCRETWLCEPPLAGYGVDPNQAAALCAVQDHAAAALLRGWIENRSDVHGRVFYIPTALGLTVADGPEPSLPEGLPDEQPGAFKFYCESVVEHRVRLRAMEPDNPSEIGFLPLPVSLNIPARRPTEVTT